MSATDSSSINAGAGALAISAAAAVGAAVVERLLDDDWRVVVPWIVERELERVPHRDGLELLQADLVIAFANAVAVEYKHDGIRCNAILPSVIDTPANRAAMPNADHERWVKPAEIAGVIAQLLSGDFGPTSSAAIPVYGNS